jgi:hypothetical protein
MVLVKGRECVSLDALDSPFLAVVVIALGAPVETVDAVRSLLKQKPLVEIVVVNSGGGGMAALLARHGIDVPVIEREEKLYAGAARNIGIRATPAPSAKVGGKEQPARKTRELLGFGSVSQPDRPARVRRSVSAKVGLKEQPPRKTRELLGFGSVSCSDRARVRRSVSAKVGVKPEQAPHKTAREPV